MIRRWLSTGGRTGAVLGVGLVELALAWLLALAASSALLEPLARHPRGYLALYAHGGRLLGDLLALDARAVEPTLSLLAVVLLAHAVAWMLLGGMFPVMGATAGVRWHRAAAESLRRAPTLLGLATIAGLGYALAAFVGYEATAWGERAAALRVDVRAVTALGFVGYAIAGLIAALIGLWHDVARAHAMGRGSTALASSGAAASQIAREPVATVAAGAGYALVGWAYVGAAALLAGLLEHRGARAVAVLAVAQHLVVFGRVHARMKWFVGLGARVKAPVAVG